MKGKAPMMRKTKGGGGGGGGGPDPEMANQFSIPQKSLGGDRFTSQMYQISTKAKRSKYWEKRKTLNLSYKIIFRKIFIKISVFLFLHLTH